MDPVEQNYVLDSCHMLGTLEKTIVHCRGGTPWLSPSAGSTSMEKVCSFHSPPVDACPPLVEGMIPMAYRQPSINRIRLVNTHGSALQNSDYTSSRLLTNTRSSVSSAGKITKSIPLSTESPRKGKRMPINRVRHHGRLLSASVLSRPSYGSSQQTSPVNKDCDSNCHERIRPHYIYGFATSTLLEEPLS